MLPEAQAHQGTLKVAETLVKRLRVYKRPKAEAQDAWILFTLYKAVLSWKGLHNPIRSRQLNCAARYVPCPRRCFK